MGVSRQPWNLLFRFFAPLAFLLLVGWRSGEAFFAPEADLWPRWQTHAVSSAETLDFSEWSGWLSRFVKPSKLGNRVAYNKVTKVDRQSLAKIIERMADTGISKYNRDEQLAYWINLYNALMVQVVLNHYPVKSPRDIDISPGWFSDGPWGLDIVQVEGQRLSLDDIEHRIIRPIWQDPRVHYAVNCAAISCPDLRTEAYTGPAIDAQLDDQARVYINDPRGVSIEHNKVTVSKIYDWYIDDFGGTESAVMSHLIKYAEPRLAAQLARIGKISDVAYNWALNDLH